MPRILCISPLCAPLTDAEAFCGAKMVKALIDFGFDVKVILTTNFRGKLSILDDSALWDFTRRVAVDILLPTKKERLRSLWAASRYQSFFARWVDDVVQRAIKLHREHEFDLIYSRSWPMVAHVAGYWCSKTLGLPWVANTNDPWDACYFPGARSEERACLDRQFANLWLQRTFRHAKLLTFPSQRLANFHFRLAGKRPPTETIPHVGSAQEHTDTGNKSSTTRALFNIVHAGKLGASEISGRSTQGLLGGLAAFLARTPEARSVVRLILIGPEDKPTRSLVDELGLQDQLVFVGRVSYEESLKRISQASVCVLVEAKTEEGIYLPSKLVDYITARKPVLALSPPVGVAADLAQHGGIVRVNPDDPQAIHGAIASFYADFQKGTLHRRAPSDELVKQFDSKTVAAHFLEAVLRILPTNSLRTPARTTWLPK